MARRSLTRWTRWVGLEWGPSYGFSFFLSEWYVISHSGYYFMHERWFSQQNYDINIEDKQEKDVT